MTNSNEIPFFFYETMSTTNPGFLIPQFDFKKHAMAVISFKGFLPTTKNWFLTNLTQFILHFIQF